MIGGIFTVPSSVRLRGTLTSRPVESDKVFRMDFVQCIHCQRAFPYTPGSKKLRGFCFSCNGFICGPKCQRCQHWEALLEAMESGLPYEMARLHERPVKILVVGSVPA